MSDYVPKISEAYVQRVIQRDFPPDVQVCVNELLMSRASPLWVKESGRNRIFLAILKLARGNIDEIEPQIKIANLDPRDVMVSAEYPRFMQLGFVGVEKLDIAARKKLQEEDWQEYLTWLNAE